MKEPGLNRKGIEYVLTRMSWYWNLASLILDGAKSDRPTELLLEDLEERILSLYKKLLLYQMRSSCLYYRNWAVILLRDTVKLDDWAGTLEEIKEAENNLRKDYEQCSSVEGGFQRDQIEKNTRPLKPGLDKINSSIQAQTEECRRVHHDENDKECLRALFLTDPQEDRERILTKKGQLLWDSYKWILQHHSFLEFRENPQRNLLWIRGDPGKGKTMLISGIIEELEKSEVSLAYFYCEAMQAAQSTDTAVLRGLIYMLVRQKPMLISHVREVYDIKGEKAFEGLNARVSLQRILTNMIKDANSHGTILVVDALDECTAKDEQHVAQIIVSLSNLVGHAKWIVSSRNWPEIERYLHNAENADTIHLELNRNSVSKAVLSYIQQKVRDLPPDYNSTLRTTVENYLIANADNTFLWVALVIKRLAILPAHRGQKELYSFPPGLDALYQRMLEQILGSDEVDCLLQILVTVMIAFRPLKTAELGNLVESVEGYDESSIQDAVLSCGSFLTLQGDKVYPLHQSATDFLFLRQNNIFTSGVMSHHHRVFSVSVKCLKRKLKRDMSKTSCSDLEYLCHYWHRHILFTEDEDALDPVRPDVETLATLLDFLKTKLLHWLEAGRYSCSDFPWQFNNIEAIACLENKLVSRLLSPINKSPIPHG